MNSHVSACPLLLHLRVHNTLTVILYSFACSVTLPLTIGRKGLNFSGLNWGYPGDVMT